MHGKGVNISGQKAGEKKRESLQAQIYDETTATSAHEEMHKVKFQAGKIHTPTLTHARMHTHTHVCTHACGFMHTYIRTHTHAFMFQVVPMCG